MLLRTFLLGVALAIAGVGLGPLGFAAQTLAVAAEHDALLLTARAAVAEKSWELARDAYAAAVKAAPDAEARRWGELGLRDATWRAEGPPRDWRQRNHWFAHHQGALTELLPPNRADPMRDSAYWCAVMESRLALAEKSDDTMAGQLRLSIADHLANLPPTPEVTGRYLAFLLAHDVIWKLSDERDDLWISHLDRGARLARNAREKGHLRLAAAELVKRKSEMGGVPTAEMADRWSGVVEAWRETPLAAVARARQFLFLIRTGYAPDAPPDSPADVIGRLEEARALLAELERVPEDVLGLGNVVAYALTDAVAELRVMIENLAQPHISLRAPQQLLPGDPLELQFGAAGYERLRVTIYRHTLDSWNRRPADLHALEERSNSSKKVCNLEARALLQGGAEPFRSIEQSLSDPSRLAWQTGGIPLAPALEPGFYSIMVEADGMGESNAGLLHLVVSAVRAAAIIDPNSREVALFVSNARDGSAVAGGRLRGITTVEETSQDRVTLPEKSETWSASLDAEGRTVAPQLSAWSAASQMRGRLAALVDGQPVDLALRAWFAPREPLVADLVFDRPLYRPGEMVNWKLILRERMDGRFVISQKPIYLSLGARKEDQKLLDAIEVVPNAFGTAHGSFRLPPSMRPGEVDASLNRSRDERGSVASFYSAFRVDNFVPPPVRAELELASAPDSLQPGREVVARVRAKYFSGGPVVGASISCNLRAFASSQTSNADELGRQYAWERWKSELEGAPRTVTTDAEGCAELRVRLPAELPEVVFLNLSATVTPDGGGPISCEASWRIQRPGGRLENRNWTRARPARPGERVEFECRVLNGADQPLNFSGTARLLELTWKEIWLSPEGAIVTEVDLAEARRRVGVGADADLPAPWRRLHAGFIERRVDELAVRSDERGRVRATFRPPHAGVFRFSLEREGVVMPRANAEDELALCVVAADEQTQSLSLPPRLFLFAPLQMTAGQSMRVLAAVPPAFKAGVLTVTGEGGVRHRRINPIGSVFWLELDELPGFSALGMAELHSLGTHAIRSESTAFRVEHPGMRLHVGVEPATVETRPGQAIAVQFRVRDQTGQPRAAEIMLAASDEAVNELARRDEREQAEPLFLRYAKGVSPAVINRSAAAETVGNSAREPIPDKRRGALLNRTRAWDFDDDRVMIGAFSLAGEPRDLVIRAGTRLGAANISGAGSAGITLRRTFSFTAAWQPEIVTDVNGEARVTINYPDNLTRWRLDAYAVGEDGNSFGRAKTFTTTSLPFQARLQAPRHLVAGDTAEIGGLLLNRTGTAQAATAELVVSGPMVLARPRDAVHSALAVEPQGEARTTWPVRANTAGDAELTLTARAGNLGDGMVQTLPVLADGFWQDTAATARLDGKQPVQTLALPLPSLLDPERVKFAVQLSPGCTAALLDALPYLVEYPYGCVEQTVSRFLPAVVARETLSTLGFAVAEVESRIMARETASDRTRRDRTAGLGKLDEVVEQSLARLTAAQLDDGGFGWWPGAGRIDPWMTAYVVWGLALASENGVNVPEKLQKEAREELVNWFTHARIVDDTLAWTLAAAARSKLEDSELDAAKKTFARVFAGRELLSGYGRACLALAAAKLGTKDECALLIRNLENGLKRARAAGFGDTAHWGHASGYWRATDGAVECTALTLLALLELEPTHSLIEPAVNWLVLNRRSARWNSTRDTAFAVLALSRYAKAQDAAAAEAEVELTLNGEPMQRLKLSRSALLNHTSELAVPAQQLRAGENRLGVRLLSGRGPVYVLALASAWTENETVQPAGHLLEAAREFERHKTEPTLAGTLRVTPMVMRNGDAVRAGEQVTAIVTITVPNDLEYVMVEVPKPAGCEPLNPLSGWDARLKSMGAVGAAFAQPAALKDDGEALYREEHDDRSVFFLSRVFAGVWQIRFGLQAVTPGNYRAAPVKVEAMYAPEVRANSDALRVRVSQRD